MLHIKPYGIQIEQHLQKSIKLALNTHFRDKAKSNGRTDVEAETPILWPPNAKS